MMKENEMKSKKPIVIVGIGQMGGVFARGFLCAGYPVYPVTSKMTMEESAETFPEPFFVLLAVPENTLSKTLKAVPAKWQGKLGLLQNELLPCVWEKENIKNPTAMAVWFEKKKGMDVHVFQPTPVYGPYAELVRTGLNAVDIPCDVLPDEKTLLTELIKKNLYVLNINIAGLVAGGTTGELWKNHLDLVIRLSNDILDIMDHITQQTCDRKDLIGFMEHILTAEPDHNCRGRVAEDRLARVLQLAEKYDLHPRALNEISRHL